MKHYIIKPHVTSYIGTVRCDIMTFAEFKRTSNVWVKERLVLRSYRKEDDRCTPEEYFTIPSEYDGTCGKIITFKVADIK